jgi:hypothetical protein
VWKTKTRKEREKGGKENKEPLYHTLSRERAYSSREAAERMPPSATKEDNADNSRYSSVISAERTERSGEGATIATALGISSATTSRSVFSGREVAIAKQIC